MSDQALRRRFFFIHVMKTGGASLRRNVRDNFDHDEIYPSRLDGNAVVANTRIAPLLALPVERRNRIRVFLGHLPFVASQMLGVDLVRLTLLREPVERTLSHLRHRAHFHAEGVPLEAIYEDPLLHPMIFRNFQAKMFAITPEDHPESYLHVLDVDDRRLGIARSNLEQLDVVGLQEHWSEMLEELERRFGWRTRQVRNDHGVPPIDVPGSLRRRIARDSAADVEFYAFARRLHERRRRDRTVHQMPRVGPRT